MIQFSLPVIGLCAYSGTGKTTLITQLLPLLKKQGLRTGVVKHAHHKFDIDHAGKDSYEFRQAGAEQIAVASKNRIAWIKEQRDNETEPVLSDALSALDTDDLDLVIVEGFKAEEFPKIELHRPSLGKPLMCTQDKNIIALATDTAMNLTSTQPQLDLNDINEIAEFIVSFVKELSDKTPVHVVSTLQSQHK